MVPRLVRPLSARIDVGLIKLPQPLAETERLLALCLGEIRELQQALPHMGPAANLDRIVDSILRGLASNAIPRLVAEESELEQRFPTSVRLGNAPAESVATLSQAVPGSGVEEPRSASGFASKCVWSVRCAAIPMERTVKSLGNIVRMPNDLSLAPAGVAAHLRMAMMRMVRRVKKQTDGEHSASEISALASLKRFGAITVGELADAEGVSRPSMTVLVTSLLEQGLVGKEPDANDRRLVRVRLTAPGNRALAESRTRRNAYLAKRLQSLDAADLQTLEDASAIIDRLLEETP